MESMIARWFRTKVEKRWEPSDFRYIGQINHIARRLLSHTNEQFSEHAKAMRQLKFDAQEGRSTLDNMSKKEAWASGCHRDALDIEELRNELTAAGWLPPRNCDVVERDASGKPSRWAAERIYKPTDFDSEIRHLYFPARQSD